MARRSINRIRAAVVLTAVLLFTLLLPCNAFAAEVTVDIFDIENSANMAVVIGYEGAMPQVTFIRPNGRELGASDFSVTNGKGTITYLIPGAARGQWQLRYDKQGDAKLDISWAPYAEAVEITSLRFDRVTAASNKTDVYFTVKSENDSRYNYAIFAAVADESGNVTGTKQLTDGRAYPNEECVKSVSLGNMQAYHEYHIYLEVWREEYDIEVSDSMLSADTFSIDGDNMYDAIKNFRASVDRTSGTLYLDWNDYDAWCDEYIVTVYNADDTSAALYNVSLDDNVRTASVTFPKEASELIAEICYIENGKASKRCTKYIPLSSITQFTMPAQELTSSQQITIGYSSGEAFIADVTVNGTLQKVNIDGDGSFSVTLQEFDNDILLSYSLGDDHVVYSYSKSISVDTTAPMLTLPENDVTLHTQQTQFVIAGAAEAGASVTVNGVAVTTEPDGRFSYTVDILKGENEFVVNAIDAAGNASSQLFVIKGLETGVSPVLQADEKSVLQDYLPLILAVAVGLVVLISALLLTKLHAKYTAVSKRYAVAATARNTLLLLAVVSAAVTVFFAISAALGGSKVNSSEIFETANRSLTEAYKMIAEYNNAFAAMIYGFILTGVLAVLFVAALFAAKLLKKRVTEPPKEKKPRAPKLAKEKKVKPQKAPKAQEAPAHIQQETPTVQAMFCPDCGTKLDEGAAFCDNCGKKLD